MSEEKQRRGDRRILADWICFTAETDVWWVCWRPWSTRDLSWAEWHMARFKATGDLEELVRAARHDEHQHCCTTAQQAPARS